MGHHRKALLIPALLLVEIFLVAFCKGAEVNLSWSDNSDNEVGFIVEASADGGEYVEIGRTGENVDKYTHVTVGENRDVEYEYRVKAWNYHGSSGFSNTVKAKGKYFEAIDGKPESLKFNVPSLTINAENVTVIESG